MKVDEELRLADCRTVWKTYLGFLDLDTDGYMEIQNRLMLEQMQAWCSCGLGQKFLKGKMPVTVAEFREAVPLTNYDDYAEILLEQREDMLPAPPAIWIKTTWEGGIRPLKVAPYTQAMLDTYRSNTAACLLLFGSYGKYKFRLGKKVMSGFAPLPYPTGLMGLVLEQKTSFELMPSREEAKHMSFSQQSKEGIKLSLKKGVDYFFSMGSVAYVISNVLIDMLNGSSGGSSGHSSISPAMLLRVLRAKLRARAEHRQVLPKDLFKLTALVCAGTDNNCYKDELEKMWGIRPLKVAPYTQAMLDTYRSNTAACLLLFGSYGKYKFRLGKKVMSGFAPLPYPTGLMGLVLEQKTSFELMPSREEAKHMSFSQQSKEGIKLSLKKGVDYFFSMGSVAYVISNVLIDMLNGSSGGSSGHSSISPAMLLRVLRAKLRARAEHRQVLPKDLFKLTALVCAGTDNNCYKDELEKMWGIRPMELFAGTEPTLIGCESWSKDDIYFFPDACFYEFLPIAQSVALHNDKNVPHATCLIDEVRPGEKYELIISVLKGGAFARYRTGDVYLCTGLSSAEDDIHIPRFRYVDRVPWVIDIAGFTRITEDSIASVIEISHLPIGDWCAAKEFDAKGHPYLHIYLEMQSGHAVNFALTQKILVEHIGIYFKYMDSDYNDLKRLLGMDPLQVSVLSNGTFCEYTKKKGHPITRINAPAEEIRFLRSLQSDACFDSMMFKAEDYE